VLVYVAYFVVVATALTYAIGATSGTQPSASSRPPQSKVMVSISVIEGTPEQTVFCDTLPERIATDTLAVYSRDEMAKLIRDLGCADD
jgi:hypothetical protein